MRRTFLLLLGFVSSLSLFGQNATLIEPIFPPENPQVVYWEAEDAVATNFAQEAILDYSSSGQKQLQLNKTTTLSQPYYAEYVVQVSKSGTYHFWYGGTPVGPENELSPSYASTFELSVDGGTPILVHRGNINVVSSYSPLLFWNRLTVPLNLSVGLHRIRIEVKDKRRYDGRYFLFLDAFFLRLADSPPPNLALLPSVFPKNLQDRSIDTPYLSLGDYRRAIQKDPTQLAPYLELAQVYTLLADYSNALKTLASARLVTPDNVELLLWIAKERLWSGELDEALQYYRLYLAKVPHDASIWAEAAKEMAWAGRYNDALNLYAEGLSANPNDLNLEINQALTLEWAGRVSEGLAKIAAMMKQLGLKQSDWSLAGQIFDVNGYPDDAATVYTKASELFPREIVFRLDLMAVLTRNGKTAEAEKVRQQIQKTFVPSDTLKGYLASFQEKITLRRTALNEFKVQLEQNPDNPQLRQTYIDALFWNGKKKEAIQQFENSLINELYRRVETSEQSSQDVYKILDEEALLQATLHEVRLRLTQAKTKLQATFNAWKDAVQAKSAHVQDAEYALALATSDAAFWAKDADTLEGVVADTLQKFNKGGELVQTERKKLAALASALHWRWDRNQTVDELQEGADRGLALSDALLLRIFTLEGNFQNLGDLEKKSLSLGSAGNSLVFQSHLWADHKTIPQTWPQAYAPYAGELQEKLAAWLPLPPTSAGWNAKVSEQARSYLSTLDVQAKLSQVSESSLSADSSVWRDLLMTRLQIVFFGFDEATVAQRYQLAEDLISGGELAKAEQQLGRVLKMDPWNNAARFRLGNVAQMLGDWRQAMNLYQRVFETDPKYSNASSLYNKVARQHPWVLSAQDKEFLDSLRYQRTADLTIQKDLWPGLFGQVDYGTISTALHDHNGGYQEMHALIQLGFQPWGSLFTLTPTVGGSYWSSVYRYGTTPALGLDARWGTSALNLDASYMGSVLPDSRLDEGPDLWAHTLSGAASYQLNFPSTGTLQSLSGRSWAQYQILMGDGNTILTASQDAAAVFHVADSPWTIFQLLASGVWESSKISPAPLDQENENRYYAPQGDLTIKGGAALSTWIGLGGGAVLGWTLRGAWGPYWQNFGTGSSVQYLVNEVETRGELTWGDWSAFVDLYYSKTPIATDSSYWSSQATIGLSAKLPNYIIP
jgi:tetratricopeptide (TPR) repeat protein